MDCVSCSIGPIHSVIIVLHQLVITWKTIEPSNTRKLREVTHPEEVLVIVSLWRLSLFLDSTRRSDAPSRDEIVTVFSANKTVLLVGAGRYRALAILLGRYKKRLLEESEFRQEGTSVGGEARSQRCNTVYRTGLQVATSYYASREKKSAHSPAKVRFARSRRFPPTSTRRLKFLE